MIADGHGGHFVLSTELAAFDMYIQYPQITQLNTLDHRIASIGYRWIPYHRKWRANM